MISIKIKGSRIVDHGYAARIEQIKKLHGKYTKVGFPSEGKVAPPSRKGSNHIPVRSMSKMAYIASIQENGTEDGRIPPRPFMKRAFDYNIVLINWFKEKEINKIISGRTDAKTALGRIGEQMVGLIKQQILNGNFIRNAPSTIAHKGHDQPIIDTQQMFNTVQHFEVLE